MARRRGLGSPDNVHLSAAKRLVGDAWTDLERMPPTCEGGVQIAARALSSVEKARAHLDSIDDRGTREANTDLFGMANIAANAAWETIRFFSHACKAPHGEARERPLTSRAKAREMLHPPRKRGRR